MPVSSASSPEREKEETSQPKTCLICGRPAVGYHYGVASCKGCKSFFRRMCVSERPETECLVGNDQCFNTQHPVILRCRSCRYQKCVLVGMSPLALELKGEEQQASNYRQLVKRAHQRAESNEASKQVCEALSSIENKMQAAVDQLTYLDSKLEMFRGSSYNPKWTDIKGLSDLLESSSKISLADKMGPMLGWPLAPLPLPGPGNDNFWKNAKKNRPEYDGHRKQWLFFDLMTVVEYAKTFDFFHQLDKKDRWILLKHVAVSCRNLHISHFTVSSKFESIINPDGTLLPYTFGQFGYSWTMVLIPLIRCRITRTEYVLLKSICFCNPAVPDLSYHAQQLISIERNKYSRILFDHCLRTRPNGVVHFVELIGILELLERQQRMQKNLYLVHVAPSIPKSCQIQLIQDVMDD